MTQANIVITDHNTNTRIYLYCGHDGYITGLGKILAEYIEKHNHNPKKITADEFANILLKDEFGIEKINHFYDRTEYNYYIWIDGEKMNIDADKEQYIPDLEEEIYKETLRETEFETKQIVKSELIEKTNLSDATIQEFLNKHIKFSEYDLYFSEPEELAKRTIQVILNKDFEK